MVVRLCQLKSLLFLSLVTVGGCSYNRSNNEHETELFTSIKPKWFVNNPQHALYDQQGKPKPHQFFDVQTELSKKDVFVKAVILTPEDSDHSYDLDVASGQRYYSHSYKFVDYDNHSFGTHQKIYSWVKVKSRRFNCTEDPNPKIAKGIKVFPDDVSWKTRHFTDIVNEKKIIY